MNFLEPKPLDSSTALCSCPQFSSSLLFEIISDLLDWQIHSDCSPKALQSTAVLCFDVHHRYLFGLQRLFLALNIDGIFQISSSNRNYLLVSTWKCEIVSTWVQMLSLHGSIDTLTVQIRNLVKDRRSWVIASAAHPSELANMTSKDGYMVIGYKWRCLWRRRHWATPTGGVRATNTQGSLLYLSLPSFPSSASSLAVSLYECKCQLILSYCYLRLIYDL